MPTLQRSSQDTRIIVIGGGVSGLTVAYYLLRKGFYVTLIADKVGTETTSAIAGALWEMPDAVCGHADAANPQNLSELEHLSTFSYHIFKKLLSTKAAGVYIRRVNFFGNVPLEKDPETQRKISRLRRFAMGLRVSTHLEEKVHQELKLCSHYSYLTPMIDMDAYLPWIYQEVYSMGGDVLMQRLDATELADPTHLLQKHDADHIINCSGLGAAELAGDPCVFPVRGAWFAFRNDGSLFPIIEEATCSSLVAGNGKENFVFILPRGRDKLVVGGIANPFISETSMEPDSPALLEMLREALAFLPELGRLTPEDRMDLRVGLRPFRKGFLRLEMGENGIIHNYGHGGSGVLLSWGCANKVYQLLRRQRVTGPEGKNDHLHLRSR